MAQIEKYYYMCRFTQQSPLRVGTGEGEDTDSDVMTNRLGFPLIPGTSIAGVLRDALQVNDADALFGSWLKIGDTDRGVLAGGAEWHESRIIISDATLVTDAKDEDPSRHIVSRDGVGINERGTAKAGAKYDFETVEWNRETGAYVAVLELSETVEEYLRLALEDALLGWMEHGVSFGARTTRGYGRMAVEVFRRSFTLSDEVKRQEWLDFDPMVCQTQKPDGEDLFGGKSLQEVRKEDTPTSPRNVSDVCSAVRIEAVIAMEGPFSVRRYTTDVAKQNPFPFQEKPPRRRDPQVRDYHMHPDFKPLENTAGKPVIPGTSWAGVFRHHMRDCIREVLPDGVDDGKRDALLGALNILFGSVEKGGGKRKSVIRFLETEIEGSSNLTVTRIAVDRFTNAPRNQALFTSSLACGGTGTLGIEMDVRFLLDKDWETLKPSLPLLLQFLAVCLRDLDMGILTVGGEANVGRGICRITEWKTLPKDTEPFTAGESGWNGDSADMQFTDFKNAVMELLDRQRSKQLNEEGGG